jgi:hypothetical protein
VIFRKQIPWHFLSRVLRVELRRADELFVGVVVGA